MMHVGLGQIGDMSVPRTAIQGISRQHVQILTGTSHWVVSAVVATAFAIDQSPSKQSVMLAKDAMIMKKDTTE